MNDDVEDDARSGHLGQAPSAQALRQQHGMVDPRGVQAADPSLGNQPAGGGVQRAADEVMVDGEDDAIAVRGVDDRLGVGHGQRHRLLDEDVLAGLRRG